MPKTIKQHSLAGFTLIEMVVSIGIFAVMSVTIAQAFASGFLGFTSAREIERNLEVAQFAMNTLAKELRTSTVVNATNALGGGTYRGIRFYDYSQERCFAYFFDTVGGGASHTLNAGWVPLPTGQSDPIAWCLGETIATSIVVTSGYVESGRFLVVQSSDASSPKRVGRVTMSLVLKQSAASIYGTTVQTTVSLRDYSLVGL